MQPETSIFQVQFNEQGKACLRKFVKISYLIIGFVVFESCVLIYWNVKLLLLRGHTGSGFLSLRLYDRIYPYISIFLNIGIVISNIFYVRFPRVLLRAVEQGDEYGANNSFQLLLKGAWIFLCWLVLGTTDLVWNLLSR